MKDAGLCAHPPPCSSGSSGNSCISCRVSKENYACYFPPTVLYQQLVFISQNISHLALPARWRSWRRRPVTHGCGRARRQSASTHTWGDEHFFFHPHAPALLPVWLLWLPASLHYDFLTVFQHAALPFHFIFFFFSLLAIRDICA